MDLCKRRVFCDIHGFLLFLGTFPKTSPAVVTTASLNSLKSAYGERSSPSSLRTSNLSLTCTLYVSFTTGILRASTFNLILLLLNSFFLIFNLTTAPTKLWQSDPRYALKFLTHVSQRFLTMTKSIWFL